MFEEALTQIENDATLVNEPVVNVGSIQALSGGTSFQTLLIEGKSKKQPITI